MIRLLVLSAVEQGGSGVTLEIAPTLNASYVLVQLYLVHGDASDRKKLREALHRTSWSSSAM